MYLGGADKKELLLVEIHVRQRRVGIASVELLPAPRLEGHVQTVDIGHVFVDRRVPVKLKNFITSSLQNLYTN
jgi:hypothetical protein